MGKIGYSSVTLTDLTETLPVTLVLETSLDQNIQTKVGNLYTPNFEEKELIITPSLFLGQEDLEIHKNEFYVVPDGRQNGYIYYQIGDIENGEEIDYYYGSTAEDSEVWVDKQGKLHIKRNLTKNLTVEANITNFYFPEHDYRVPQVSEVTPLNILLLEAGSSEYSAIITSSGREYFDEGNTEAITLTALLYKGATPLSTGVSYKWDIMTDIDTDIEEDDGDFNSSDFTSREQSITVTRDKVHNTEIFICEMSLTDGSGLTFTANKILRDFSDEYSNSLFASSSTILNPKNLSVKITNQVRWQTEIINGGAADQNRFKYEWSILPEEGEQIDLTGDSYKNKTIEIVAGNGIFPKEDFTVLGKVTIDNKVTSFSYINIIYRATIYTVELSPKTFFIPVDSTGKITAESFSKEFSFKLLDENKKPVPFETGDDKIKFNKKDEDTTSISLIKGSDFFWEDSYLFNLDIKYINNIFLDRDDPLPYEFSYVYLGQKFQEEINIIKVFKGEQGEQGINGLSAYTISLSEDAHHFSAGELRATPGQKISTEIKVLKGEDKLDIKKVSLFSDNLSNDTLSDKTLWKSDIGLGFEYSSSSSKITIFTGDGSSEQGFFTQEQNLIFYITVQEEGLAEKTFSKGFQCGINYKANSYKIIASPQIIYFDNTQRDYALESQKLSVSATYQEKGLGPDIIYSSGKLFYSVDDSKEHKSIENNIIDIPTASPKKKITLYLLSSQASEWNENYILDSETIEVNSISYLGGENLIPYTQKMYETTEYWGKEQNASFNYSETDFSTASVHLTSSGWNAIYTPTIPFTEEMKKKKLTFSCEIKTDKWAENFDVTLYFAINNELKRYGAMRLISGEIGIQGSGGNIRNHEPDNTEISRAILTDLDNDWKKLTWTFTPGDIDFYDYPKDETNKENILQEAKYCSFCIVETATKDEDGNEIRIDGDLFFRKMKLELGSQSTEWSPNSIDSSLKNANLIPFSEGSFRFEVTGKNYDAELNTEYSYRKLVPRRTLKPRTTYTLSFETIDYSNFNYPSSSKTFTLCLDYGSGETEQAIQFSLETLPINYSISFTTGIKTSMYSLFIMPYAWKKEMEIPNPSVFNDSHKIVFSKIKLEEGPIATSYEFNGQEIINIFKKTEEQTIAGMSFSDKIPVITLSDGTEIQFTDFEEFYKNVDKLTKNQNIQTNYFSGLASGTLEIENDSTAKAIGNLHQIQKSIGFWDKDGEQYLEISRDGAGESNDLKMRLDKERLSFFQGAKEVAYFSSSELYITKSRILETFKIGKGEEEGDTLVFTTTKTSGVTVTWE